MALGPRSILMGDMVCIVKGYHIALILRSLNEREVLIGKVYIYRIMCGEVIEGQRRDV